MTELSLFNGINADGLKRMHTCCNMQTKLYNKFENISVSLLEHDIVYMLYEGEANVVYFDVDGNRLILERLVPGSIFSRDFAYGSDEAYISCLQACKVLLIDRKHLLRPCENACRSHTILINNFANLLSLRSKELALRIRMLSQRSIRSKLLTYLEILSVKQHSLIIDIPVSLSDLADYLCIDRSAMFREIKKMNEEGLINSKGRKFIIRYRRSV